MNPKDTPTKDEFLEMIYQHWSPEAAIEMVSIDDAAGRVLARDLMAKYDFPVYRAAMMDGVAVKSADFAQGMPDTSGWKLGVDYVRADTGDDFDDAFDSVIMIEWVELKDDGSLTLNFPEGESFKPGMYVKPAGANQAKGSLVAEGGKRISALTLAAIAYGGYTEVPVLKRPKVGYIPTGSELVTPYEVPQRGQNIASNVYMIRQLILEYGGEPVCYPIVKDDLQELAQVLDQAIAETDIILMSGGSSKGSEDFTMRLFEERGQVLSHWVRAVPGRPMGVAIAQGKPLINLSGPTLASFNGMEWCVRQLVGHFLDGHVLRRYELEAEVTDDIQAPPILSRLVTIAVSEDETGRRTAKPMMTGRGKVSADNPMLSNGYYMTVPGKTAPAKGDTIRVSMLSND